MSRRATTTPPLLLLLALCGLALAQETYPDTFDKLDLQALLADEARMKEAVKCLLEAGDDNCQPAGKLLKQMLPEIVRSNCAKCTESQVKEVGGFFAAVSRRYPQLMKLLLDKYDPTGAFRKKYARPWAGAGIKV